MGVTVLQPYSVPEGQTGPQTIEFLAKRLLALGAVQASTFIVDCETFIPNPQHGTPKTVHVLHNSEYPASTFAVLDTGTKQVPLVADALFDLLMLKMAPAHTSKKQTKIESKGARFEYGDFLIKLGSVTMAENFKGILLEVEYRPCVIPSNCWELIRELLQGFLGVSIPATIPPYFNTPSIMSMNHPKSSEIFNPNHTKQNDVYQPMDTINQYLEHFGNFRKQTMLSGGTGIGAPLRS
ncbi:unnamed protein product [Hermetia illucens]|uniref:Mediator of RNA polymerase II transcription subunit 20 n=1 Tax=Hermetia illucens TaxID=343691 RepID=A0A7R8YKR1_HERIL|nr:mediator of RNA polymerase II transcription subunit 20 [Hermetia illucens]CAD7076683.1 unnamed protein product [Hermetia illucens]